MRFEKYKLKSCSVTKTLVLTLHKWNIDPFCKNPPVDVPYIEHRRIELKHMVMYMSSLYACKVELINNMGLFVNKHGLLLKKCFKADFYFKLRAST